MLSNLAMQVAAASILKAGKNPLYSSATRPQRMKLYCEAYRTILADLGKTLDTVEQAYAADGRSRFYVGKDTYWNVTDYVEETADGRWLTHLKDGHVTDESKSKATFSQCVAKDYWVEIPKPVKPSMKYRHRDGYFESSRSDTKYMERDVAGRWWNHTKCGTTVPLVNAGWCDDAIASGIYLPLPLAVSETAASPISQPKTTTAAAEPGKYRRQDGRFEQEGAKTEYFRKDAEGVWFQRLHDGRVEQATEAHSQLLETLVEKGIYVGFADDSCEGKSKFYTNPNGFISGVKCTEKLPSGKWRIHMEDGSVNEPDYGSYDDVASQYWIEIPSPFEKPKSKFYVYKGGPFTGEVSHLERTPSGKWRIHYKNGASEDTLGVYDRFVSEGKYIEKGENK